METVSGKTPTATLRERKGSTGLAVDRFHRQARRHSILNENSAQDSIFQGADPFAASQSSSKLARADTGLGPTDLHPGNRLPSVTDQPRRLSFLGFRAPGVSDLNTLPTLAEGKEFAADPVGDGDHHHDSRPFDPENPQAQIERAASKAHISYGFFTRKFNNLLGRDPTRPRGNAGLQIASAIATAHANAFFHVQAQQEFVYISDYVKESDTIPQRISSPFSRWSSIETFLEDSVDVPALRVIHIYNHTEAMRKFTKIFCIDQPHFEKSERSFGDWIQTDTINRWASNKTVIWRPAYDLARNITCTAFALELGSPMREIQPKSGQKLKTSEALRAARAKDTHHQRLTVYMQRQLSGSPPGARMAPFNSGLRATKHYSKANTILIYESAQGEHTDIISGPKLQGLELRHPTASTNDPSHDSSSKSDSPSSTNPGTAVPAALPTCIPALEILLLHILESVLQAWRRHVAQISVQHARLEDQVYERPSDDSHAGSLWAMSHHLLEMAKLVNRHATLVEDLQDNFNHFAERDSEEGEWFLDDILKHFRQRSVEIQEDFIKPTEHMIDLMYKSVSIRDSRQSLELNASLWRLSWITFIFLPLTFLVGLFGMNVQEFQSYPSIRWYFVAVVPLMLFVLGLWFTFKIIMPQATKLAQDSDTELQLLKREAKLRGR